MCASGLYEIACHICSATWDPCGKSDLTSIRVGDLTGGVQLWATPTAQRAPSHIGGQRTLICGLWRSSSTAPGVACCNLTKRNSNLYCQLETRPVSDRIRVHLVLILSATECPSASNRMKLLCETALSNVGMLYSVQIGYPVCICTQSATDS